MINWRWFNKKAQTKVGIGFIIFTATLVGLALLGVPYELIDKLAIFLVGVLIVNPILSLIVGACVERFGGDSLKGITLTYEIFGFEFSFTAYGLLTFILVLTIRSL